MNRVYKTVWNEQTGTFVAVAETTKSRGKKTSGRRSLRRAAMVVAGALGVAGGGAQADITLDDSINPVQTDGNALVFSHTDPAQQGRIEFENGGVIDFGAAGGGIQGLAHLELATLVVSDNVQVGNVHINQNGSVSGLSDGTLAAASTSAVTGGQLFTTNQNVSTLQTNVGVLQTDVGALQTGLGSLTDTAVRYDAAAKDVITLEGAAGTRLTNLADGALAAGSTDAVTGGQLHALQQSLFEDGEGVRYFHANSTADDAQALGVESIAIGPDSVAEGDNSLVIGQGAGSTAAAQAGMALGQGAQVGTVGQMDGVAAMALGRDALAQGNRTIAIGDGAEVSSQFVQDSLALGTGARISGMTANHAIAIGAGAMAGEAAALAMGLDAQATGVAATALGREAQAAAGGVALGDGAQALAPHSISLGSGAGQGATSTVADEHSHIAIGVNAGQNVDGNQNIAMGWHAGQNIEGDYNVAIGNLAGSNMSGDAQLNVAIGHKANENGGASLKHATAVGAESVAGEESVAMGYQAQATSTGSVAIGREAVSVNSAGGGNSGWGTAVGYQAQTIGDSIALGARSVAVAPDAAATGYITGSAAPGSVLSLGNSGGLERRITHVADGSAGSDAVNVRQLQAAQVDVAQIIGGGLQVVDGKLVGEAGSTGPIKVGTAYFGSLSAALEAITDPGAVITPTDPLFVRYVDASRDRIELDPNITGGTAVGTVIANVADATDALDAVNKRQLDAAIADGQNKYFSIESLQPGNRNNTGAALGLDAIAIGPEASAEALATTALGFAAIAKQDRAIALGNEVKAEGIGSTVLGNESIAYDTRGVAIGAQANSRGENSIVIGTGAESDLKDPGGATVDNAIVIGTVAEVVADDGIAIGRSALAEEERAIAQGYDAHATGVDAAAFGTASRASAARAYATGTRAQASGVDAQATGTDAHAYAERGVAMGTGAVAGLSNPTPGQQTTNIDMVAIGSHARATGEGAIAMGRDSESTGLDSMGTLVGHTTAIGDASKALGEAAVAMGYETRAVAVNSTVLGSQALAEAGATHATVVGAGAQAQGAAINATILGAGAGSAAANTTVLGAGARADQARSVALGDGAVTAAAVGTSNIVVDKQTYQFAGSSPVATVSVGTDTEKRTLTNVAAGRINANSTDAINGSQLYATNRAVDALGDDLDDVGDSMADALGGGSTYNPTTHTVTASLTVGGNTYNNVQEALGYVGQGWDVAVDGEVAGANVAPGGKVDFSNDDGNIDITRAGTDLAFNLSDDLVIDHSITVGDTIINGDRVTANNLTVTRDVALGDHFTVDNSGVYYDGPITHNHHIVNKQYLDTAVGDLAGTPLTFAGDAGTPVARTLGQTVTMSGGATDPAVLVEGNIGVVANGADTLAIKLNKDLDLGATGSVKIGDALLDTTGLSVTDAVGNTSTTTAAGTILTDGAGQTTTTTAASMTMVDAAGNTTSLVAGNLGLSDGTHNTQLGATQIVVGGGSPLSLDGTTGIVSGLQNQTINYAGFADGTGRAASEEQLKLVSDTASAGWNVAVNNELTGANVAPGGKVDFSNDDGNIVVARTDTDLTFNLDKDIDLTADGSIKTGNSTMNNAGLTVADAAGNTTTTGATGTSVTDAAGNTTNLGAGSLSLSDGTFTTDVGPTRVVVGGDKSLTLDGDTGLVSGLSNQTIYSGDFANGTGKAASEEQLGQVYDVAVKYDTTFDPVTGDPIINYNQITLGDGSAPYVPAVRDPDTGEVITPASGGTTITNVAWGSDPSDAVNVDQLNAVVSDNKTRYFSVNDAGVRPQGNYDNDGATGQQALAAGTNAMAAGDFAVAVGDSAHASVADAVALGAGASASHQGSVALGAGSVATGASLGQPAYLVGGTAAAEVSIGSAGAERRLTNVAAGSALTDAVNVAQLKPIGDFLDLSLDSSGQPIFNYAGNQYNTLADALDSMHWNVEVPGAGTGAGGGGAGAGGGAGSGDATPIHNTHTVGFVAGDNITLSKEERTDDLGNVIGADVHIAVADDLEVNSVTATTVNATTVNATDVMATTVQATTVHAQEVAIDNGPVINQNGINMHNQRITNLADGINAQDAVNVRQLQAVDNRVTQVNNRVQNLEGRVHRLDKKLSAGVAAAMATAALPQAYMPGKSMAAMGGATWNGETGFAIGVSTITDNGKWVLKLSGNATSRGDYGAAVGAGYQW